MFQDFFPIINLPSSELVNFNFSARNRLDTLATNAHKITPMMKRLYAELYNLDLSSGSQNQQLHAAQQAFQIKRQLRYLEIQLAQPALEIDPTIAKQRAGYSGLRRFLANQFVEFKEHEQKLWLNTFYFIITPDVRSFYDTVAKLYQSHSIGQMENILLKALSGMGKTSMLDYLVSFNLPYLDGDRTVRPIVKADAPPIKSSTRALYRRLVTECGGTFEKEEGEDALLYKAVALYSQCSTILLLIDEIEHLGQRDLRRRFVDFSNQIRIPMVCASCDPEKWIRGDKELEGRFKNKFILEPYTGDRLTELLAFIEMLLPFSQDSFLALRDQTPKNGVDGPTAPGQYLAEKTGGIMQDLIKIIMRASLIAIDERKSQLTVDLMKRAGTIASTEQ